MTLGERLLLAVSRDPGAPAYQGGTVRTNLSNALDFLQKTVPGFLDQVQNASVLDCGCGFGWQAAAVAQRGARRVVGLDLPRDVLLEGWKQIDALALPNLTLTTTVPDQPFDVVYSCSSFEHFRDPAGMLATMKGYVRPGGKLIVSFAEPWWSPYGSHMDGFTRLPWVNVVFSEATVMRVRARYFSDGASQYEDIEGGLNRMTVARFEQIIRGSGMHLDGMYLRAVKRVPLVTRMPVVREFFTTAASCVLTHATFATASTSGQSCRRALPERRGEETMAS